KAVHRVLLVRKDFKNGRQLGHDQQFDIPASQIDELHVPASLAQHGRANDQGAQPCAVDVIDVGEVQNDAVIFTGCQLLDFLPEGSRLRADRDPAVQVEDSDPLSL